MTSSASRCSSTTMAPRPTGPAHAAPARTSPMRAAVAETLGIPHYVLDYEERFRQAVIDPFADELRRRRDADPVRLVQPDGQVRRPSGHRARARRRRVGHRPLYPQPRRTGCIGAPLPAARRRRATSAISCSPPPAIRSTICAFRSASGPRPRSAISPRRWAWRSPPRPTARTSASCRRAAIPTSSPS